MALTDELLRKAYGVAFFIHGDEAIATRIVARAAAKLDVAVSAQNKRLYYRPVRAALSNVVGPVIFRRKIWSSDIHLFQRLVYIESEFYEKLKEQHDPPPGTEDMAIHFIKHLVRITFRRNSFYVALGLSRLLYNYSTAQTMNIYNAVVQDPERVKDDYYYRSRKGILMTELKNRFGDLLRTHRGPRGEERFVNTEETDHDAKLVKECLTWFTPWRTPCLVPNMFDPILNEISGLATHDLKNEYLAEANRIHALTHPTCYQLLVSALGFPSPDEKLSMPRFFFHRNNQTGPRSGRREAPEFDAEKLMTIRGELAASALRRKKSAAGLLRVLVDGEERARLDPRQGEMIRFLISRDAELIELVAADSQGELLLATLLLNYDMDLNELPNSRREIVLEGGQKISIRVLAAPENSEARMIDVMYRADSLSGVTGWARRLVQSSRGPEPRRWRLAPIPVIVLTLILFSLGLIELGQYWLRGNRLPPANVPLTGETPGPLSIKTAPAPTVTNDAGSSPNSASENVRPTASPGTIKERNPEIHRARRNKPTQPDTLAAASPSPRIGDRESAAATSEQTRAPNRVEPGVLLPAVRKVFVESSADTTESKLVVERMLQALRASGSFDIAPTRDDAQAVLKISVRARPNAVRVSVHALLVNVNGKVLWPLKRGRYYSGSPEIAVKNIVRNLLRDIKRSQKQ